MVIGGGPAGSSAATVAARGGADVLVLERDRFPRFHIGESLLPESNRLLEELGVAERVREEGFVVKRGASFWTEDGERESYIDFSLSREVAKPKTYQVPRDRFDELLLNNARAAGAEVLEGCRADRFCSEQGESLMTYSDERGRCHQVAARTVIDASGQRGFVARSLDLRRKDRTLRCVAEHSQFEGVLQLEGERAGDIRIVSMNDMSWVWLIPITATLTSVGLVTPSSESEPRRADGESLLESTLRRVPSLANLFESARRVAPVRRDADFSYAPTRYAGDGWLLAGDAGSFLDPVFSTGVLLALESGCEAGRAALAAISSRSKRPFVAYDRAQAKRYRYFRKMVAAFYDPAFRDIMFQPATRWGLLEAVVTTLAGNSKPRLTTRLRMALLFGFVTLHRRIGIGERIHRTSMPGRPA